MIRISNGLRHINTDVRFRRPNKSDSTQVILCVLRGSSADLLQGHTEA